MAILGTGKLASSEFQYVSREEFFLRQRSGIGAQIKHIIGVCVCVCVVYGTKTDWMVKHTIELLSIPLEPVSSSATR